MNVTLSLSESCLNEIINHYHFSPSDKKELIQLYEEINPYLDGSFDYKIVTKKGVIKQIEREQCVIVIASLSKQIDDLQNKLQKQGEMLKAYMLDCLALELLKAFYEKIGQYIREKEQYCLEKLDFIGEEYPLELLEEIFTYVKPKNVRYNKGYQLIPHNSVVFVANLIEKEKAKNQGFHICEHCKAKKCEYRKSFGSFVDKGLE